jgi:hypothetical protein
MHIVRNLPDIVADALDCEAGHLTPQDIMIQVDEVGPFDSANLKDLNVTIYAHDYPERAANLDSRRMQIERGLKQLLGEGQSWYVWIFLEKSSYGSDTMS